MHDKSLCLLEVVGAAQEHPDEGGGADDEWREHTLADCAIDESLGDEMEEGDEEGDHRGVVDRRLQDRWRGVRTSGPLRQ